VPFDMCAPLGRNFGRPQFTPKISWSGKNKGLWKMGAGAGFDVVWDERQDLARNVLFGWS